MMSSNKATGTTVAGAATQRSGRSGRIERRDDHVVDESAARSAAETALAASRGGGGAGVSNAGTITTLTNSGTISGGARRHFRRDGRRGPVDRPATIRSLTNRRQRSAAAAPALGVRPRGRRGRRGRFERRRDQHTVQQRHGQRRKRRRRYRLPSPARVARVAQACQTRASDHLWSLPCALCGGRWSRRWWSVHLLRHRAPRRAAAAGRLE